MFVCTLFVKKGGKKNFTGGNDLDKQGDLCLIAVPHYEICILSFASKNSHSADRGFTVPVVYTENLVKNLVHNRFQINFYPTTDAT
jgi:hypothetical protein